MIKGEIISMNDKAFRQPEKKTHIQKRMCEIKSKNRETLRCCLNKQFGETATATDGAYYAWILLTDT